MLKTPFRGRPLPSVIQNFDQKFWSIHLRFTDFPRKKGKIFLKPRAFGARSPTFWGLRPQKVGVPRPLRTFDCESAQKIGHFALCGVLLGKLKTMSIKWGLGGFPPKKECYMFVFSKDRLGKTEESLIPKRHSSSEPKNRFGGELIRSWLQIKI